MGDEVVCRDRHRRFNLPLGQIGTDGCAEVELPIVTQGQQGDGGHGLADRPNLRKDPSSNRCRGLDVRHSQRKNAQQTGSVRDCQS